MPKVWNIGNTTVRNPKRIENALNVFVDYGFSGNAKGSYNEKRLHSQLKENAVLDFDGEPSGWNGRKWRAAFYQLGFIAFKKYNINNESLSVQELFHKIRIKNVELPYSITPAGLRLLRAKSTLEIEDIYLRQYLSIELPNNFELGYPKGRLKPFVLFLEVLYKLNKLKAAGLSKHETGLFLQLFQDQTAQLSDHIIAQILLFRKELANEREVSNRRKILMKQLSLTNQHAGFSLSSNTVFDYADTTFRYFSLTGIFKRNSRRIEIRPHKLNIVSEILKTEPNFIYTTDPLTYHKLLYSNGYKIPTDDKPIALNEIREIVKTIRDKKNPLIEKAKTITSKNTIEEINKFRYQLLTYNNSEREVEYAKEQSDVASIETTIKYLKVLNGESVTSPPEIDDKPSYLEWSVWRAFLTINEIINKPSEARRFPVDYDFYPRNTAPGGGSDLIFEFENFILVVEVTLTKSHRQMSAESEPVRRHTVQYQDAYPGKEVYCLFIAPTIDNNVAESYRIGVWYKLDSEEFINIVPMNLRDFINAFEIYKLKKFSNEDFRQLLDRCLVRRNVKAPQWQTHISSEVQKWVKRQKIK